MFLYCIYKVRDLVDNKFFWPIVSIIVILLLALKNCMNVYPNSQEHSKHTCMDMNPTRRDCITYIIIVPCRYLSNHIATG